MVGEVSRFDIKRFVLYRIMYFSGNVKINGRGYDLLVSGYKVRKEKVEPCSRSKLRKVVERYVYEDDVDKVTEVLLFVHEIMRMRKIGNAPRNRFLLVRICSALGCGVKECLRDIWPSYERRKHEYLLYGVILPMTPVDVSNCIYWKDWAAEVVRQCKYNERYAENRWRSWREYWEEHWRREESGENEGFIKCGRVELLSK